MVDRECVLIFASSYQQAVVAARSLGLPTPNKGDSPVRYIDRPQQVYGIEPDRVVFVEPRIERTIVDRVQHDYARQSVLVRMRKPGVEIEHVTT